MRKLALNINTLFTILMALFIGASFVPVFSTNQISILMGLIILVGVVFYSEIKRDKAFWELILFIIVMVSYYLLGKGLSFNFFALLYWILCFGSAIVMNTGIKHIKEGHIKFLITLLIGFMLYTNISTIIISISNPMAVRKYGYSGVEGGQNTYGPFIMYSYGVGEALAIITPVLLAYSFRAKKQIISFTCIFTVVLSIVSQAMAALTASLFLTLLSCSFVVLSYIRVSKSNAKFRIVLIVIIILMIGSRYVSQIISNNYLLVDKFGDVFSSLRSGSSTGDVSTRSTLIIRSLKAWLANPLFGGAEVGGLGIQDGVSMHSALFDYLGLYGIFTLLLIGSWKTTLTKQLCILSTNEYKYYRWIIISLVLLLIIKGPVTIAKNYFFSVVLCGLLIRSESLRTIPRDGNS